MPKSGSNYVHTHGVYEGVCTGVEPSFRYGSSLIVASDGAILAPHTTPTLHDCGLTVAVKSLVLVSARCGRFSVLLFCSVRAVQAVLLFC